MTPRDSLSEGAESLQKRPGAYKIAESRGSFFRLFSRRFLPFWCALLLAILATTVARYTSTNVRLTNLDLAGSGFPETFLMLSKSRPDRGYLVNRRASTIRRSMNKIPGTMRQLERFGGDPERGAGEHWLIRSKKYGTDLLVPVEGMVDWSYPFLYDFVRREHQDLALPVGRWTHLHVNRIYRGLYYRLSLPLDPRKKDGGSGVLREFLMVQGERMTVLDTRFDPAARLYANLLTDGILPQVSASPAAVTWLAERSPLAETTFLLGNQEPFNLERLPLPLSIQDFYRKLRHKELLPTRDERFTRWTEMPESGDQASATPFDAETFERLRTEFARYALDFRSAYMAHRVFGNASAATHADYGKRDAATADLGLRLGAM